MQHIEEWRQTLQDNINTWMEEFSSYEEIKATKQDNMLDLYGFYEELCVFKSEFRKSSRRNQDVFSTFGDALSGFETVIKDLSAKMLESEKQRDVEDILEKKKVLLPLVEMLERTRRILYKLESPPGTGFFVSGKEWKKAWSNMKEGITILLTHFEELIKKQGIEEIEAYGKLFDPYLMTAVEVEEVDNTEPNKVLDVLSAGFYYRGDVLKLAEVKLSKTKEV